MNVLTDAFRTLAEAWRIVRKRRAEARDAADRAAIAKAFNDRYTYRQRLAGDNYAWMCPECNRTHASIDQSAFDGLHYPACCSSPYGNRLSHGIKTRD